MKLTHASIENFRAISRIGISFDPTTVMIAENAYGKSSIVRALTLCLGHPAGQEPLALHRSDVHVSNGATGTVRVTVTLEEHVAGDWDNAAFDAIRQFMSSERTRTGEGTRTIRLRARCERSDADSLPIIHEFVDADGSAITRAPTLDAVALIRRLVPLLLIRADRFAPQSGHDRATSDTDPNALTIERLFERAATNPANLIPVPESLHHASLEPSDGPLARWLARSTAGCDTVSGARPAAGAKAIAMFIALDGLLRSASGGVRMLDARAHPIVAIEEPEMHLHPVVLALMWDFIESLPAQRIVTTNSADFVAMCRLSSLRRLVRTDAGLVAARIQTQRFSDEDLRRISYHVRSRRGGAFFARAWLLLEGETEYWLIPELAKLLGFDLDAEGVCCVEFAQCGVDPLVHTADDLGIWWHLVADGDAAGLAYASRADDALRGRPRDEHITTLHALDIEHRMWESGFAPIYRRAANGPYAEATRARRGERIDDVIAHAIKNTSKPELVLEVVHAAKTQQLGTVPPELAGAIRLAVAAARRIDG